MAALLLIGCTVNPSKTPLVQTAPPSLPSQEVLDERAPLRLVNPASLDAAANVPKLSRSEMQALFTQVRACWAPPIGVDEAKDLVVVIRFAHNRDGTLSGEPSVINKGSTPLFHAAAESAIRAVRRCQPFRLPNSKYEAWRDIEISFDSSVTFRR
jgi:hypothetical protein